MRHLERDLHDLPNGEIWSIERDGDELIACKCYKAECYDCDGGGHIIDDDGEEVLGMLGVPEECFECEGRGWNPRPDDESISLEEFDAMVRQLDHLVKRYRFVPRHIADYFDQPRQVQS